MNKQTKILLVVICGISIMGISLGSGIIGFWLGRRAARKERDIHAEAISVQLERLGANKNIPLGQRDMPGFMQIGPGIKAHSLMGDIQEIDDNGEIILVLSITNDEVWEVHIDDDTIIEEDMDKIDADELEVGDRVMVEGKKDTDEGEMDARLIILMKSE